MNEIASRENILKDQQRFEKEIAERAAAYKKTVTTRAVGVAETTRLNFKSLIGVPVQETENIINARLAENNLLKKSYFADTPKQIKQFKKNILRGNASYPAFAVMTAGFRSFSWQDDETGNSFVHYAVQLGYVELLEELLKYKADCNLIYKLGNAPIHDCWFQWLSPPQLSEVRKAQESKTCDLLRHLLTYNAYPDNLQKTDGCTPLHIAARLGPVKAVMMLLGFKADYKIKNRAGQTPVQVAAAHGQLDIVKVLNGWEVMRTQAQHADFAVLWKVFIANTDIPMRLNMPLI
jgi:hypothetical protein